MKKIISLILLILLTINLFSCKESVVENIGDESSETKSSIGESVSDTDENSESSESESISDSVSESEENSESSESELENADTKPPYVNENFVYRNDYKAEEMAYPGGKKFYCQYYTDEPLDTNILDSISIYVNGNTASEKFASLYINADEIKIIPVYGAYLEYTSLAMCLFLKDGQFTGAEIVSVKNGEESQSVTELVNEEGIPSNLKNTLVGESVKHNLTYLLNDYPSFNIEGYTLNYLNSGSSYGWIGRDNSSENLSIYTILPEIGIWGVYNLVYDLWDGFRYIGSIDTIEEGQEKYKIYWNTMAETVSYIMYFENGYDDGLYCYKQGLTEEKEELQYTFDSDREIFISLLDENGNEGEYGLWLLYLEDKLIAEIVIRKTAENTGELINERISLKDENGNYIGLDKIDYVEQTNDWLRRIEDISTVKGMYFDGAEYRPLFNTSEESE